MTTRLQRRKKVEVEMRQKKHKFKQVRLRAVSKMVDFLDKTEVKTWGGIRSIKKCSSLRNTGGLGSLKQLCIKCRKNWPLGWRIKSSVSPSCKKQG